MNKRFICPFLPHYSGYCSHCDSTGYVICSSAKDLASVYIEQAKTMMIEKKFVLREEVMVNIAQLLQRCDEMIDHQEELNLKNRETKPLNLSEKLNEQLNENMKQWLDKAIEKEKNK